MLKKTVQCQAYLKHGNHNIYCSFSPSQIPRKTWSNTSCALSHWLLNCNLPSGHSSPLKLLWKKLSLTCNGLFACPTLQPHRMQLTRLLCPWDFPGKNTRAGSHFLLQGIFPTQGSNLGFLHCRRAAVSHQGSHAIGSLSVNSYLSSY